MMITWRTGTHQSETSVASMADDVPPAVTIFRPRLNNPPDQQGLRLYEVTSFLNRLGISRSASVLGIPSVCDIADLLRQSGPLWVTTGGEGFPPSPHAEIIIGIHGDGTPAGTTLRMIDPADGSVRDVGYVSVIGTVLSIPQWPQWRHF
jgi:hypothetical protein